MQASQPHRAADLLREAADLVKTAWWRFVDWVAVVEWRQLIIIWLLTFFAFGMLQTPEPAIWFVLVSLGVKVLAGGKRKAELDAAESSRQADVATLERK
ncbi:MAG: sensor histidine kinase, partial [Pseudomonadota bacterium]|nr:sensor histidine kinase [Pseudomonadota bacterium]